MPGLVSNISTFGGIWANAPSGKDSTPFMCPEDETRLTKKDDDYLTYTLMNPHKIEAKFHLNVLDLYQIDFTHPYRDWETDRKSTRLNSSHRSLSRMPSSA